MPDKYTILLAEDHPIVRAGVRAALDGNEKWLLVGETVDTIRTIEMIYAFSPDLLILDVMLGSVSSLDWLERFHECAPRMKILVLSALSEGPWLSFLSHSAVAGFVAKSEATQSLQQAIRVIQSGGSWFSQGIAAQMRRIAQERKDRMGDHLTMRERQILDLMRQGKNNATVATELGISVHTVRRCATLLYQKLGVNGRIDIILQDG
ncbi:response regulator transcription factor [bacterium]|nr:response regulator transcription factor [bacterium]